MPRGVYVTVSEYAVVAATVTTPLLRRLSLVTAAQRIPVELPGWGAISVAVLVTGSRVRAP